MTMRNAAAAAIFLFAACTVSLSQGLYWESSTESPLLKQKTLHSTYAYMPGMMKQESKENGSATIFRLDKQLMISLNERNKTYSEMSFDDLESMMKKKSSGMDQKMEAMQEQMKKMPEEQRKMMEKDRKSVV